MTSKSAAAANLCTWVVNIYRYNRIYVKASTGLSARVVMLHLCPYRRGCPAMEGEHEAWATFAPALLLAPYKHLNR